MNKIFFRGFRLYLLIIMLGSMLLLPTGCAGTTEADKDEFQGTSAEPVINKESAAITFYFPGSQPDSWPDVKAKIEEKINDTVNARLDFRWINTQQYIEKMSVLAASEQPFDAFCLGKPENYYPDFTKLARKGKLKDISQLFISNAPGLRQKYTDEELDYGKVDGKLYALPSLYPRAYATYLLLSDELLKRLNISEVLDLKQYDAYLKAAKMSEPDLVPGVIANGTDTLRLFARGSGYVIVDDIQKLVYKWDDPSMKVLAWEKTPEFKEAMYYIADWFKNRYLVFGADQSKASSFVFYGNLEPPTNEPQKLTVNTPSGQITETVPLRVFYLYPDKPVQRNNPMGNFFFNGSFVFPSTSANTERALQFLDWVNQSRDNYYLMMYGIEGKDYVLDKASGNPTFPNGMDYNNRTYMFWDGSWALRNLEYTMPTSTEDSTVENPKQFLERNSKYAPHGAFYPNYNSLETTAINRSSKFLEFEEKFNQGLVNDKSEIDKFIKAMDTPASDNLIAEVQKQLDAAVKARKQ